MITYCICLKHINIQLSLLKIYLYVNVDIVSYILEVPVGEMVRVNVSSIR